MLDLPFNPHLGGVLWVVYMIVFAAVDDKISIQYPDHWGEGRKALVAFFIYFSGAVLFVLVIPSALGLHG